MDQIKTPSHENVKSKAKYANFFKVGYNAYEFIIDFCQYYCSNGCCSETEKAELCQRLITSPAFAKTLLKVMQQSVKEYEKTFGTIAEEQI
jgi:hypothetical protein